MHEARGICFLFGILGTFFQYEQNISLENKCMFFNCLIKKKKKSEGFHKYFHSKAVNILF